MTRFSFLNRDRVPNFRNDASLLLGPLTGLLLALSYPSFNLASLAWVAFLPLLFALYRAKNLYRAIRSSAAAGLTFFLISCYWLSHVSVVGCVLVCLLMGLFFIPFGMFVGRLYRSGTSAILWGSIAWVAMEFLRTYFLSGFPWNTLASSQAKVLPLIQMACVTGAYGVSFMVILANLMLFEFWLWLRDRPLKLSKILFTLGVALITAVFIYGYRELGAANKTDFVQRQSFKVAAVQPYIPQEQKWDPVFRRMILERLRELTLEAAQAKPLLVVWPETCVPGELRHDEPLRNFVQELSKEIGAPILVGSQDSTEGKPRKFFNAAMLVDPQKGIVETYAKRHLVPYGEYLPGATWFPFLRWFIPIPEDFSPGPQDTIFQLRGQTLRWREPDGTLRSITEMTRFGVMICFEDIFPETFRRFCLQRLTFMVNMTNDAWFKKSGASVQHANLAVFRAVENRIPLLRATNTGYTCLIDSYGRITADVSKDGSVFVPGVLVADITSWRAQTIYNRMGDFFAYACLILTLLRAWIMVRDRRRP